MEFRAWWDNAGRRGASPQVSHALRDRHQNSDLRDLVARVTVPVLHLVNPTAPAHDPGHDRYLETNMSDIETQALPGPDELWWLDTSGSFASHVERFTRHRSAGPRARAVAGPTSHRSSIRFAEYVDEVDKDRPAPRPLDRGLGHYESTAAQLLPAARAVIDSAAPRPGKRVVDLGCGTGNAALLASARAARR